MTIKFISLSELKNTVFFYTVKSFRLFRVGVFILVLCAVAAAGKPLNADQRDPELVLLFKKLKTADDFKKGQIIENKIWALWNQSGRIGIDRLMAQGIAFLSHGEYHQAVRIFSEVIRLAPNFSEGWNKRATSYYLLKKFELSIKDIRETLKLEPRHFGALSGMGLICIAIRDTKAAIIAFEAALKINPHLGGARNHIDELMRELRGFPS